MIRDAQQQAFGNRKVPQVKPGGRFAAPSVPTSNLVFRGGGVRCQPTMRGNLLTAVAGVAAELLRDAGRSRGPAPGRRRRARAERPRGAEERARRVQRADEEGAQRD